MAHFTGLGHQEGSDQEGPDVKRMLESIWGRGRRTDVVWRWECSSEGLARWHSLIQKYSVNLDPLLSAKPIVMPRNGNKFPIGITIHREKS